MICIGVTSLKREMIMKNRIQKVQFDVSEPSDEGRLFLRNSSFPVVFCFTKFPKRHCKKYAIIYSGDILLNFNEEYLLRSVELLILDRRKWNIVSDLTIPNAEPKNFLLRSKNPYTGHIDIPYCIYSNKDYSKIFVQIGDERKGKIISLSDDVKIQFTDDQVRGIFIRGILNDRTGKNIRYFPK